MPTLAIDLETYSSYDLTKCGVYAYANAPDFTILLIGYAFDDEPVAVIDMATGEEIPQRFLSALTDPKIIKTAYNANFERTCLATYLGIELPANQWRCTAVHASMLGLPGNLDAVTKVLGLPEDKQKMQVGKILIRYFSKPCAPSLKNNGRTRNLPAHDPEKWDLFKNYCAQDVEVERVIRKILSRFPIPDSEQRLWELDQAINDTGVRVDMELVKQAIRADRTSKERLEAEAIELTGLSNPKSVSQLKAWLESEEGIEIEKLTKESVPELLNQVSNEKSKRVLAIRKELAKSSVAKYEAIARAVCPDSRVRGLLQFYGANRTGRWAGRLVQVQNLPQNKLIDLSLARELIRSGDHDTVDMLFGSVTDTLSQLIRTAFIPADGHRFIVADFSAIEARVIAWLAGEQWVLDVFRGDGKIYEATASQMFRVPIEKIKKGNPEYALRQKGKVATLACIAEGQLVLTHKGLIPIEQISRQHLVWDGVEFVEHDGVVCHGMKEVITYDGLTATEDHIVWVEGESEPIQFGESAARGAHLLRTAGRMEPKRLALCSYSGTSQTSHGDEPRGNNCRGSESRERKAQELAGHRRKARVYDILNAGPRNRYTVSNCLVHNCGYQGGAGALIAMGALKMGLAEEELPEIVSSWRMANPHIVKFWADVEKAALWAVEAKTTVKLHHGLVISMEAGSLCITLPSGRKLVYVKPRIEIAGRLEKRSLVYEGIEQGKKTWGKLATYGGKIVENIVQGTARDCLAIAMMRLHEAGYRIVMHVHDEVIMEMPDGTGSLDEVIEIMSRPIPWAEGLPLTADGYECDFYRKE